LDLTIAAAAEIHGSLPHHQNQPVEGPIALHVKVASYDWKAIVRLGITKASIAATAASTAMSSMTVKPPWRTYGLLGCCFFTIVSVAIRFIAR
jgi:hypothetical protein